MSEQHPEELQSQERFPRLTGDRGITGESESMSEMPSEIRVQAVERTTRLPAELPSTLKGEARASHKSQPKLQRKVKTGSSLLSQE